MRLQRFSPVLLLALAALAACDTNDDPDTPIVSGVVVVNQGNFSQGNGTVTSYDPATGATVQGASLSSTLQGALVSNGLVYVTADKAGRVDVFDAATLARSGAPVSGLGSARYLALANNRLFVSAVTDDSSKGYTSGGLVSVIDVTSRTVVKRLKFPLNTSGLAVAAGRVFVAVGEYGSGRNVAVINPSTLTVERTIEGVCDGPRSLFVDDENELNVFCTGTTTYDANYNVTGRTNGAFVVLDPASGTVKARVDLGAQAGATNSGQDGAFDAQDDVIYYVQQKTVRRFSTRTNAVLGTFVTPEAASILGIGAVGFDAQRRELHLGLYPPTATFSTAATVAVYPAAAPATARTTYTAGIAPTSIVFR